MKKWTIFGIGVLTGVVMTFVLLVIFAMFSKNSDANEQKHYIYGATWFDEPGDTIETKEFKVFQVIEKNAALANGRTLDDDDDDSFFSGVLYLLVDEEGKYYYDEQIVKVPNEKVARQVGVYEYETRSNFEKTVPIIKIMNR